MLHNREKCECSRILLLTSERRYVKRRRRKEGFQFLRNGSVFIRLKFKRIYFASIEKQALTTYTNLSRFCSLAATSVQFSSVQA